MKLTFNIDSDGFDSYMIQRLQQTYTDHITRWLFEPDSEKLAESLLTIIEHFMVHSEFEEWYETIKEL